MKPARLTAPSTFVCTRRVLAALVLLTGCNWQSDLGQPGDAPAAEDDTIEAVCRAPGFDELTPGGLPPEQPGTTATCEVVEETAYAGQHTAMATASIFADAHDLRIAVEPVAPWVIHEAHVYVSKDPGPLQGRRPAPGRFPYNVEYDDPAPSHLTVVPLSDLDIACGDEVNIAVHLSVEDASTGRRETAWVDGPRTFTTSWGWWRAYDVCCVDDDGDSGGSGTTSDGTGETEPPAGDEHGRFVVGYTDGPTAQDLEGLRESDAAIVRELGWISAVAATVEPHQVDTYLAELRQDPRVAYAERDVQIRELVITHTPTDPLFVHQWGLHNWGYAGGVPNVDVNAPAAWGVSNRGEGQLVALLDTPVDIDHVDLRNNVWSNAEEIPDNDKDDDGNGYVDDVDGWNFSAESADVRPRDGGDHGTHMAGIIAAQADNGMGLSGVAPRANLLVAPVLDGQGRGWASDAAAALEYADRQGARVANLSWGASRSSRVLREAIEHTSMLIVAPAGNDAADADAAPVFPAAEGLDNVLSVTAVDRDDMLACFANWGRVNVDIGAPGEEILSTVPGDNYSRMSGTSAAAAHASGVAALVLAHVPGSTPRTARQAILDTAIAVDDLRGRVDTSGRLDAFWAVGCEDQCHTDAHCDDGRYCNGEETCSEGECVDGAPPACAPTGDPCLASECDDDARACVIGARTDDTPCPDADACNGAERCSSGVCVDGPDPSCGSSACTIGSCDPAVGCVSTPQPDGTQCPDTDPCNGAETCEDGQCVLGTPINCDDGDPCTADSCEDGLCGHVVVRDGSSCNDGDPCNGAEVCVAGVCEDRPTPDCDDGNPCTVEHCEPGVGCVATNVPAGTSCGFGDRCNGGEICEGPLCVFAQPLDCDDANPCTIDTCDLDVGCSHEVAEDGSSCGDGVPCNGNELCQDGACTDWAPTNCDDGNPCTSDWCDPELGCDHEDLEDDLPCSPGDACTTEGVCGAGLCRDEEIDCDDGNPCTADFCDAFGCGHDVLPDDTSCTDFNVCNGAETCQAGQCAADLPLDCGDADACTDDLCSATLGCIFLPSCGTPIELPPETVTDPVGTTTPADPLEDPTPINPIVVPEGTSLDAWRCDFIDLTGGTVFSPEALVEVTTELGSVGTLHIEVECGTELLGSLDVDLATLQSVQGGNTEGIIPTQLVIPIPGANENLSLLNCAQTEIWVEGEDGATVYWSYAGLTTQVDNPPPQACSIDADCDDAAVCNGAETCVGGWCEAGPAMDCSGLDDACNVGVCYEPQGGCLPIPLPDPACSMEYCGDSILQPNRGETCDHGFNNDDAGDCTTQCQAASCGDGLVHAELETCDDGNAIDTDACPSTCQPAACGDGAVWASMEACDDGNADDSDACLSDCTAATCGDGKVWSWVEECDDANADDSDACLSDCAWATCGDGFVQAGAEECDDGNLADGDGCDSNCTTGPIRVQTLGAGRDHSCVILGDGSVRCWGNGAQGQLGNRQTAAIGNDEPASDSPVVELGFSAAQIAVGGWHACAASSQGSVRCWGLGSYGALGYGDTANVGITDVPADRGDVEVGAQVSQIDAGERHTCAVTDAGGVRCWGDGTLGRLGYGDVTSIGDNEQPHSVGDVPLGATAVQVATGRRHTCALSDTGTVHCWGDGTLGQLGYGNTDRIGDDEPPVVAGSVDVGGSVVQLSAGDSHTCALLSTGAVRCWGTWGSGRLGYGTTSAIGDDETPASAGDVPIGEPVAKVSAGVDHTCAQTLSGTLYCWGEGLTGRLGYGTGDDVGDNEFPSSVGTVPVGSSIVDVQTDNHTCIRQADGQIRCWGPNVWGQLGYGHTATVGDDETPASVGPVPAW